MNDVSGNSEVKPEKETNAQYQARRRKGIADKTWQVKARGARKAGPGITLSAPQSCPVAPSTQALPRLDLDGYPIGG